MAGQRELLRRGSFTKLHAALTAGYKSIPKSRQHDKRRERLLDAMKYLANQQSRMRYKQLRKDDIPIATGAAEGAVRNLIAMRLDGPGMRWGRDRAEMVLHLRCVELNGQWRQFEQYLAARDLILAPQPVPARPHVAKPRSPQPLAEAA